MSDAPRWPGPDGKPGLIFAPEAAGSGDAERASVPAAEAALDTQVDGVVPEFDEPEPVPTFVTRDQPLVPPEALPAQPERREPVTTTEADLAAAPVRRPRRTRKARLRLSRIDPWSVMKTSFLFSIAFGVMLVVAVFALWSVLASSGALESANHFINTLIGDSGSSFDIEQYLSVERVMGLTVVLAAVDVVILTAVATLFSFLYNLSATVLGGLEVTLAED